MISVPNDKISDKSNALKKQNIIFFILVLAVASFSIWKAPMGFDSVDEAFYLTIPKRILQGENLLTNEWHLSQFSGILLIPFMWVYNLLGFENGEYIILFHRYAYILVLILVSIFIYSNIKNRAYSVITMIPFMLFVPHNLMSLNYNSMGVMFLTAALSALSGSNSSNTRKVFFSGLFFSAAVLCNPYLISLYGFYFIFLCLSKRIKPIKSLVFVDNKVFLNFTLGCIPLAVCVILLLLRAPVTDIVKAIPLILSDPEHPYKSFVSVLVLWLQSPFSLPYSLYICFLYIALITLSLIFYKKTKIQNILWIAGGICTLIFMIMTFRFSKGIDLLNYPIVMYGFISFLTSKNKDWNIMFSFYTPAMIYTFLINLSSNLTFIAVGLAMATAIIPSMIFIFDKANEFDICKTIKINKVVPLVCSFVMIFSILFFRIVNSSWHTKSIDLKYKAQVGWNKGIVASEEYYTEYIGFFEDTEMIRNQPNGNVIYIDRYPGFYLSDNKKMASYSAWTSICPNVRTMPQKPNLNRLNEYYELYPDSYPDYIYIKTKEYSIVEYIMNELSLQGELYEGKQGYTIVVNSK